MDDTDIDYLILKNVDTKPKHDEDILSAEDLAWADSCLIKDPEISEANMDSLKEALLYILDQHTANHSPSVNEQDNFGDKTASENSHSVIEEEASHTAENSVDQDLKQKNHDALSKLKKRPFLPNFNDEMMNIQYSEEESVDQDLDQEDYDFLSILKKQPFLPNLNDEMMNVQYFEEETSNSAEKGVDHDLEQENYDALSILKKQPFAPTFNDEMMNIQYSDDGEDDVDVGFVLSEFVTETRSDEDIFKVWDLDIAVEEAELDKQLKEVLSSNADDNTRVSKTKGLKIESIDSLVESIADLSIK